MLVDERVAIPRVFVLAYSGLKDRRILQSRNVLSQIGAQTADRRSFDNPHARIRIEGLSVAIESDFQSTTLNIG